MTEAPAVFVTGMDSPVTMDSSIEERPSMTIPSTGIFSPGRTRNRSPTWTRSIDISSSDPPIMRRAVFGARSSNARMACPVRSRARSSKTCPSSTNTVMVAAASKYAGLVPSAARTAGGKKFGPNTARRLYPSATPVPMAIKVNMLRERIATDRQPRTKNGHPAHDTTGVANAV